MTDAQFPFDPNAFNRTVDSWTDLARVRRIGFLIFPNFDMIDLCGPRDVFFFANPILGMQGRADEPGYQLFVIAAEPGPVRSHCGLEIIATHGCAEPIEGLDTLIVVGGVGMLSAAADQRLIEWLKAMSTRVRRLASVCSGAFLLAAAGLLNNRRVTTHWLYCEQLAAAYPALRIEPDRIFVRDGGVYTSGGITSGIDLALALIEEDLGREIPRAVAGVMVVYLRRPGGQTQFSPFLQPEPGNCRDIGELKSWILGHVAEDLSVERLAAQLSMSPRNFARRFREDTGDTPAKFVEFARIEAARCQLEQTRMSLEAVAKNCGFGAAERMRRAFQRHMSVGPHEYRERFQTTLPN